MLSRFERGGAVFPAQLFASLCSRSITRWITNSHYFMHTAFTRRFIFWFDDFVREKEITGVRYLKCLLSSWGYASPIFISRTTVRLKSRLASRECRATNARWKHNRVDYKPSRVYVVVRLSEVSRPSDEISAFSSFLRNNIHSWPETVTSDSNAQALETDSNRKRKSGKQKVMLDNDITSNFSLFNLQTRLHLLYIVQFSKIGEMQT